MPARFHEVVRQLRNAVLLQNGAGLTDRQLLGRFIEHRDEAAVAALLRRHGPMVWGVCRRVLRNHHDAEDAVQATFLVLVRKARSVEPREMVGNWLYGVAHQTAIKARAMLAKRRARESQVTDLPEREAPAEGAWRDLEAVLDQELSRLPNKYRVAIVQCDLEGKTRKEAARQLGLPEGTLAGRLTRGRALLARRLARYGPVLSGGPLAVLLSEKAATACVPTLVLASTIKTAMLFAAEHTAAAGAISANVAALTKGVLSSMLLTKLKTAAALSLIVCVLGTALGAGILAGQAQPATVPQPTAKRTGEATKPPAVDEVSPKEDKLTILDSDRFKVFEEGIHRRFRALELQNKALLKELESLRKELKPSIAAPARKIDVFLTFDNKFTNTQSHEVARALDELFNSAGQQKTVHIAVLPGINTIIVRGGVAETEAVAAMFSRIERHLAESSIRRPGAPK